MADKTLTISIVGDELIIDPALDAFVRQNGWKDGDTQTQTDKARDVIRAFIMEQVTNYNVAQAISAAAATAAAQTNGALDMTTMTISVA